MMADAIRALTSVFVTLGNQGQHVLCYILQAKEFQVLASEFLQRLKSTGPGLPNTDLAKGLELLKKFQVLQDIFACTVVIVHHKACIFDTAQTSVTPASAASHQDTDLFMTQQSDFQVAFQYIQMARLMSLSSSHSNQVCPAACVVQEENASISQQREQLVLAEKLFGMDITGYPDLVQVHDPFLLDLAG